MTSREQKHFSSCVCMILCVKSSDHYKWWSLWSAAGKRGVEAGCDRKENENREKREETAGPREGERGRGGKMGRRFDKLASPCEHDIII